MEVKVSIIIINYNTFDLTCKCIESIYAKTIGLNYEIILVDNNSTDTNPENFLTLFPNIILVKSNKNIGFAKGNNLGIKKAKGETILLLNSDIVLINNAIKICYDRLHKEDDLAVISSALFNRDNSYQKQCNRQENIIVALFELFRIHKLLPKKRKAKILQGSYFDHKTPMYTDKVWGAFFMIKKEIINSFPNRKLHDDFFMYGEDVQWSYYIRNILKKKRTTK